MGFNGASWLAGSSKRSAWVLGVMAAGCGSAAPPPEASPAPPRAVVTPAPVEPEVQALPAQDFGEVTGLGSPLVVSVPDVGRWERAAAPATSEWLSLNHAPSRSSLELRVWRGGRRARPEDCAEQLGLWRRHVAELGEDERVSSERMELPHGFDAQLSVFVRALGTEEVEGHLIAVGARPARCLAVVFRSVASGQAASRQVAERLRLVADVVLPSIELRSVEDRATREPPR